MNANSIRPADTAGQAAEAVRALNHATAVAGDSDGYRYPSDLDATLAELALMASRLPQALTQARTWLTREHAAGRVGADNSGAHPSWVALLVGNVGGNLARAIVAAGALTDALDRAREDTARLTGTDPTDCIDATDTTGTTGPTAGGAW